MRVVAQILLPVPAVKRPFAAARLGNLPLPAESPDEVVLKLLTPDDTVSCED